ncbi:PIG-L family deacetylase [Massilia eurypsychrophila]|jgi:LmbE family N-acetylglucosaminyl deacetylase|uniref:PIG-L family deacetylase n=1 Tax=Massilia eurypsychrophila TaxID=1485217 RepID=A0A2G8TG73_9BURK|nr:PIG-L family deacetylase [Massilia eurypsychrophila]PIL45013.1 PIG-L family deacetylase [Massilia eurypsychrophila]
MKSHLLLDQLDFDAFERVVILSPHLDDAALSCGGLLHALQGVSTLVVTLCSGNPPPVSSTDGRAKLPARRGHVSPRIRRAEDIAAMRAINAEFVHLSFPDSIYRRSPDSGKLIYRSARERWAAPHAGDAAHIEELFQLLRRICLDLGPVLLVSPMGIGDHVDHQITARVAMRLAAAAAGASLLFYEDFPYVAQAHSGRGDADGPLAALARLHLAPAKRLVVPVDVDGKMRVLRHYVSQVPVLFGSDENMRAAIEGNAHEGQACERYWRARNTGIDTPARPAAPTPRKRKAVP